MFVCIIRSKCVPVLVVIVIEDGGVQNGDLSEVPFNVRTSTVGNIMVTEEDLSEDFPDGL